MNLASFGGPALALRTHVTKRVEAMTPRQRKASRALSMASLVALMRSTPTYWRRWRTRRAISRS